MSRLMRAVSIKCLDCGSEVFLKQVVKRNLNRRVAHIRDILAQHDPVTCVNKHVKYISMETRPSYRSQLRDTKLSSYQSRVRPSSRNFDDDKPKHNDVDSYLSRRNNATGRTTTFSDRDKDKNDTTSTTTASYASRRRAREEAADATSTTRDATTRTSSYLRASSDNLSTRMSEREKERQKEAEKEKEKENEKQSEKEKAKEKETEKESVDKSSSAAARARKNRRPREKRRSTGVAYMPSESDEEEPDELQEAKKNTMMNEDIEEKHKSKEEPKSRVDRIRAGRTTTTTSTTDRYKNTTRASDSKIPTDVNTLQDKLRETQTELDETKTKLEKTVEEKNKLERKLDNMEEDLKQLNDLKEDNQRLKDENGALIRVISKLSRTPT